MTYMYVNLMFRRTALIETTMKLFQPFRKLLTEGWNLGQESPILKENDDNTNYVIGNLNIQL